jgi:hypothetical protein
MKNKTIEKLSLILIIIGFIGFIYMTFKAFEVVAKRRIGTDDGIYENRVSTSADIKSLALKLTSDCKSKLCKVQRLLDYVTNIPYKINDFRTNSPQKTIKNNFGDCDDKSNLLISMLHALDMEAYFVLVPNHIFIIAPIEDKRLDLIKGIYLNGKKMFILESTAKGSGVGYPLTYKIEQIDSIIEPFSNEKIEIRSIVYKR